MLGLSHMEIKDYIIITYIHFIFRVTLFHGWLRRESYSSLELLYLMPQSQSNKGESPQPRVLSADIMYAAYRSAQCQHSSLVLHQTKQDKYIDTSMAISSLISAVPASVKCQYIIKHLQYGALQCRQCLSFH